MTRAEGKYIRRIGQHRRRMRGGRSTTVSEYYQRYDRPRGDWRKTNPDKYNKVSATAWLMDRHGRFIGRMNSKGKTSTPQRRIHRSAYDRTRSMREITRYGRIKGRSLSQ